MKKFILLFILSIYGVGLAQQSESNTAFHIDIIAYQNKMNADFTAADSSPLVLKDRMKFTTLDYYPPNKVYKIEATFKHTFGATPFEMATTTDRKPIYQEFGTATFELDGKTHTLHIYQNLELMKQVEYKDYLFIPFLDLTNNIETYGGGRFLEAKPPIDGKIILDFNKAYNPYCAYNYKYSCPIPPKENKLDVAIKAGVKAFKKE